MLQDSILKTLSNDFKDIFGRQYVYRGGGVRGREEAVGQLEQCAGSYIFPARRCELFVQ